MSGGGALWPLVPLLGGLMSVGWSALVLAVCAAMARLFPAAGDRHLLWWAGLILCVLPILALPVVHVLPSQGAAAADGSILFQFLAAGESGAAAGAPPQFWSWLAPASVPLLVLYGAGLAWHAGRMLRGRRRLARVLAGSTPVTDTELRRDLALWQARLNLRRLPELNSTPLEMSPFLAGGRRPVLVLPCAMLQPTAEAALICAHELAHLRRGDVWLVPLQRLLGTLAWFNPFVLEFVRRLNVSREEACDALVLGHAPGERRRYARALLAVLRLVSGEPVRPAAPGIPMVQSGRKEHEMRVKAILSDRPARSFPVRTALGCGLLLAALGPAAAMQAGIAERAAGSVSSGANIRTEQTVDALPPCPEDAQPVKRVPPSYPVPEAEARVTLSFTIAPDGSTRDVKVVESSDDRFDQAAMESLRQWRYQPCGDGSTRTDERVVIAFMLEG